MLDGMQARARCEHPAGEDALDLALQRHFVDFDKGVRVRRLGRRSRVASSRGDLKRAELDRFADRGIERNVLSRPENTARPLSMCCVGVSVTTVSSGCGEVSAGWGGGGLASCGVARAPTAAGGGWGLPGLAASGGAAMAQGGGGKG
jgi:hypothetical protein